MTQFNGLPPLTPGKIETRAQTIAHDAAAETRDPANPDRELAALQVAATMLLFRETRRLADAAERIGGRL